MKLYEPKIFIFVLFIQRQQKTISKKLNAK